MTDQYLIDTGLSLVNDPNKLYCLGTDKVVSLYMECIVTSFVQRGKSEGHLSMLVPSLTGGRVTHLRLSCPLGPDRASVLEVEVHHGALTVLHHLQVRLQMLVLAATVARFRPQPRSTNFL